MSLNLWIQICWVLLASVSYLLLRLPEQHQNRYDTWLFRLVSGFLVAFAAFRPLGVGVDDLGYATGQFEWLCPTTTCGRWIQGPRDQAWYSIVGLLRSFYPLPQVSLLLVGVGLVFKLWVIDQLCRHRCLALLFYLSCFYIIHDITALRVSLAISIYLLGFYLLVLGRFRRGAALVAINGFFHQQAFLAPLLLLGRWIPWSPFRLTWALVLPLVLLITAAYPNDWVLKRVLAQPWGKGVADVLFGHGSFYLSQKLAGGYDQVRIWPVVAPPTLLLAAWLHPDLHRSQCYGLFCYAGTSLAIAAWLLWGYAVIPEVQLRFWHFFLVPIVFVIGNVQLTRWKLLAIIALSAMYLLKYTVMHQLLLDQRRVHWETPVGGQIALQTPGIFCGEGCGFNVTQGSTATLQATSHSGYRFDGWFGACAGLQDTCNVTVNYDVQVGASFVPSFILQVGASAGGVVEGLPEVVAPCTEGCDPVVDVGKVLSLKAVAASRYRFVGSTGDCAGTEPVCTLTMDANKQVTPQFMPTIAVTLEKSGDGSVKLQGTDWNCRQVCSTTFDAGLEIVVMAAPAADYRFAGWTGACAGQKARCAVKADTDLKLGVRFVRTPHVAQDFVRTSQQTDLMGRVLTHNSRH